MMPGIPELAIIFAIILIIFGAGKAPKVMKDLGTGIRDFRKAVVEEPKEKP